jgi:hypothetical protein
LKQTSRGKFPVIIHQKAVIDKDRVAKSIIEKARRLHGILGVVETKVSYRFSGKRMD